MSEIEKLSFKEALNELQNILQKLEEKEYDLEKMTKLYEKGLELKKYCSNILDKEKTKIRIIAEKNGVSLEELGLEDEE